jgi:uncharacterized protein
MKMNSVVHFEMPTKDGKRVSEFYTKVFGWEMVDTGPQMGNYITATTTESPNRMPIHPGAINGGFFPASMGGPNPVPSVVIAVDDIKEHIKLIESAGGKVIDAPVDIPGVGWYVSFYDTEGNRVSILQPYMK